MRRWRRWVAALVLCALGALLLAPATAPGTRLLAALANGVPGVALSGIEGRLFGSLRVAQLVLALPGVTVEVGALRSELRPTCLPRGELCFRRLEAATVRVAVAAADAEAGQDRRPAPLPFPLRAGVLAVDRLALAVGGTELSLNNLAAERLRLAERQINAGSLAATLPAVGRAAGEARLALDRGWPLAFTGTFAPAAELLATLPADLKVRKPLTVALAGPPSALALELEAAAAMTLLGGDTAAAARGTLRWPDLTLDSLTLASPAGNLTTRGAVDLAARRARLAVTASNVAPALPDWPLAPASGSTRLLIDLAAGPRIVASQLQLTSRWREHALTATGSVTWERGLSLPALDLGGSLAGQRWHARGGAGEPVAFTLSGDGMLSLAGVELAALQVAGELAADGSALTLSASAADIRSGGAAARAIEAQASLSLGAEPRWSGEAEVSAPTLAGRELESLTVRGTGGLSGGDATVTVAGAVAGELAARAAAAGDGSWALTLSPLVLATPAGELVRDAPLALTLVPDPWRVRFPDHCWSLATLSLCAAAGEAGARGEVAAELDGALTLPAETIAALAAAKAVLAGELNARWGGAQPPALDGSLRFSAIALTPAGLTAPLADPGTLALTVQLQERLRFAGELTGGALGRVGLMAERGEEGWKGRLAVASAPLAYLQPLVPALAELDGTVSGELTLAASGPGFVTGGTVALRDGRLRPRQSEAAIEALALTLRAGDGGVLAIDGNGRYGGAPLAVTGELVPGTPRLSLALKGERNVVHWPGLLDATVSPTLSLSYADGLAALEGELRVHGGRLAPDQVGSGGVSLSPDAEIIGVEREDSRLRTRVDLRILVEERFRVVGELLDATVGGDVQLRQSPGAPLQLFGRVAVIGGELRAYGQQLELREGSMAFAGDPGNPDLALRAERQFPAESLRVGFTVTGSLSDPSLDLYSEPQLPREAQLAWLIRGRPPDAGASMDGTALALSVGASALNQTSLVRSLNRVPGLSNVSLGTDSDGSGTAATISGYVGDRLYLSYGLGLYEPVNTLTARLYLRARLWLETVSALENSVDLYYRFDID